MATAAEATEQLPKLDLSGGLLTLDAEHGWTDIMEQLKAEAAKMTTSTFVLARDLRSEDAIASPETYDVKTDPMALPIVPLGELIKKKLVKPAKELSAAETLDTADALLAYFALYCQGSSHSSTVDLCAYVHDFSLSSGTSLGYFVLATLKAMVFVGQLMSAGHVRDGDEEFSEVFLMTRVGQEAHDIELPEAPPATDPLHERITFVRNVTKFLVDVATTQQDGFVAVLPKLTSDIEELLQGIAKLRTARSDALVAPTTVFNEMGSRWNCLSVTPRPVPVPSWESALDYFEQVINEIRVCATDLFEVRADLVHTLLAVKRFAAREPAPVLLSRAAVGMMVIQGDTPLGGENVLITLFRHLKNECGAPWFQAFLARETESDNVLLSETVKYLTALISSSGRPAKAEDVQRQLLLGVTSTGLEVGRLFVVTAHAYLRNRGRCHRSLVNSLSNIAAMLNSCASLERGMIVASSPSVMKAHGPLIVRNEVLTNLVSWLMLDTCYSIVTLTQQLGLLTMAELPGALWFHQSIQTHRADVETTLRIGEAIDPKDRRAQLLPPVVVARTPVLSSEFKNAMALMEVHGNLGKANVLAVSALLHTQRLPECELSKRSLQCVSSMFNHRFTPIVEVARRPYIVYWDEIMKGMKQFAADIPRSSAQAVEAFKNVAARAAALRATEQRPEDVLFLQAVEEAAKKNAVVVGLAFKMDRQVSVQVHPRFPEVVSFALLTTKPETA